MPEKSPVSRRTFVQAAGVATAAAVASKYVAAPAIQKVKAAGAEVKYGFIGPGSRGARLMERHLTKIDAGRCVAVCDVYQPNLDSAAKVIGTNPDKYNDYRELLARKDVEAVFITVPLYLHYPIMRDALLAGKHVFCEKSLVFTPEEYHGLKKLHEDNPNLMIQVGLQRRYSLFYQLAEEMVRKGTIGEITHIFGQWHRNTNWRRPLTDESLEKQINWRMYREFSGGLTAELASHQIDIADRMMGETPLYVQGIGGLDYFKDGRDIYDNILLDFVYPSGKKFQYSSITTNAHLPYGGLKGMAEFGEVIKGTEGSIEITLGKSMWFREPVVAAKKEEAGKAKENWVAGSTVSSVKAGDGFPLLLPEDELSENDSFLQRELKYARRWLYSKGVMVPEEEVDPEYAELRSFLEAVRDKKPESIKANIEVGLLDSLGVMLSNKAMDEGRRVYYSEIDKMGVTS
ncbi:MAG: Gfo/Idh/MocA family oxidoreductase [Bryobacterales bacterium]|nr:Gfo/Idh/MocA family oxidoreductase [Bryobacterales bacterium]